MQLLVILAVAAFSGPGVLADAAGCPSYTEYAQVPHDPRSSGKLALPFQRPVDSCRTFHSNDVEALMATMKTKIGDADLFQLFQNAYPNTLDTAIKWHGMSADNKDEELTFVVTGDIDAMWLRDSANQLQTYMSLLVPDNGTNSLASLFRGVINLQARYIRKSPFCNAFLPPVESGFTAKPDSSDTVTPPFDPTFVWECKWELDSLAAFLQLSQDYFNATGDSAFFSRFHWVDAVKTVLSTAYSMQTATYDQAGAVLTSPYVFQRLTRRASETLTNDGIGEPVANGTGLIRSAFRPSDDVTTYQLLIPSNMMFAANLRATSAIADAIGQKDLANEMRDFAKSISYGIERYGTVVAAATPAVAVSAFDDGQTIYAYEINGFGSVNIMDDANIPSLLSAPLFGYVDVKDDKYQRTRNRVLATAGNPYMMHGNVLSSVGGPHLGPGKAWPMASIVRILTSDDDKEIVGELQQLVSSTGGLGLIHESVDRGNATIWSRPWFAWANGLFGQMIVDLEQRKPAILQNFKVST